MKDAYYFPHDSNAKDDPKCILLIEQLGLEGYGIYWVLVETLRDQTNYCYPIQLLPALARRFNTTLEKMKIVVFNYGLFEIENDTFFFSKSLIKRMSLYEEKKIKRSLAGKKGNEIRWQTDRIAIANGSQEEYSKVKESKVKENKKTKEFIPPIFEDVKIYFTENGYSIETATKFFNYYKTSDWKDSKGAKVKNWKQKAIGVWFKDENKTKLNQPQTQQKRNILN